MNLRLGQWRALREIERNLAGSDQRLDALFLSFTQQARAKGKKMPRTEKIKARPLRLAARLGHRADRRRAMRTSSPGFG